MDRGRVNRLRPKSAPRDRAPPGDVRRPLQRDPSVGKPALGSKRFAKVQRGELGDAGDALRAEAPGEAQRYALRRLERPLAEQPLALQSLRHGTGLHCILKSHASLPPAFLKPSRRTPGAGRSGTRFALQSNCRAVVKPAKRLPGLGPAGLLCCANQGRARGELGMAHARNSLRQGRHPHRFRRRLAASLSRALPRAKRRRSEAARRMLVSGGMDPGSGASAPARCLPRAIPATS